MTTARWTSHSPFPSFLATPDASLPVSLAAQAEAFWCSCRRFASCSFSSRILEDSGYLARAAFVMERVMRVVGLPGKAFTPMLSAHACAIPGIMAARVIDNWRDRLVTILVLHRFDRQRVHVSRWVRAGGSGLPLPLTKRLPDCFCHL